MGLLYIANVTRQRQVICYRLDVNKSGEVDPRLAQRAALQQAIESGRQAPVGGDLHPNQMAQIIDQLGEYGLVGAVDVPNNLGNRVVPFVFNIDIPVSRKVLDALVAHNAGVKIGEGATRRERAAIAANEALKNQVDAIPQTFDVEFEQEEVSELGEKSITEGFHVVENPEGPKKTPGQRAA